MPVDGPRNQRFDGDTPKTLHGIAKLEMYIAQAVDPQGYRRVVLVGKVPNEGGQSKLVTFPENLWEQMGVLPKWLEDKVRETILPDEVTVNEELKSRRERFDRKSEKAEQLRSDDVNVMGV